jgi:hypothetical protein
MTMPDKAAVFDKLMLRVDDVVRLRPCFDVTLYWSGSHLEKGAAIVDFYRRSLSLIGSKIRFYRTETMGAARALKKDSLDLIPLWFTGTKTTRDIYSLFLETGSVPDEPSDRAFALSATPGKGYARVILPVSVSEEPRLVEQILALGNTIPFDSGQAGYAVNWNHLGRDKSEVLDAMSGLTRYPGLDLSHASATKVVVTKGLKGVNWFTFVGPAYVDQLGGTTKLRRALGKNAVVHELNHGVAIQAGPTPELGDTNRRDNLPIYHEVGRVLAPVRARPHPPIFGPDGISDPEITEKWLSRFDS